MGVDMVDITAKRAELSPHRVAFEDVVTGATRSYAALDDRAARCAALFAARGVGAEDRIAILCRNRIEFFEVMFACAKLGAILVPLNWRVAPDELARVVADCEPKLIVFGQEDALTAQFLTRERGTALALDDEGADGFEAQLAAHAPHAGAQRRRAEDIWSLLYTSGTTGEPKAVIQTYQMALVNYVNADQAFDIRSHDSTLNFLPLFHAAGIHLLTMPTLMAGGRVLVAPGFDVERTFDLLGSGNIDLFFAVPTVYQQLAAHPRFAGADFSRVRVWGCGGAALRKTLADLYNAKGVCVRNGYGMTETGPTAFVASNEHARSKTGSVGRPQLLLEARLVGADGADVADGNVGEFWMRGPGVTPGYWRRPDATARLFSADGWLKSGDLGMRDSEGCYYVVGRLKDMYISGGENVYPAEIEAMLARHPSVFDAAVIGVADEQWGETGLAFVQVRQGAPMPDARELIDYCRQHLAAYKAPKAIVFVDDLPRTPSGKVCKHVLQAGASAQAVTRPLAAS